MLNPLLRARQGWRQIPVVGRENGGGTASGGGQRQRSRTAPQSKTQFARRGVPSSCHVRIERAVLRAALAEMEPGCQSIGGQAMCKQKLG